MNQLNTNTSVICYGEILWDVLPDGPQPGGAPLNVAYHLSKMGISTGIISRVGLDDYGQKLEKLIDSWGIGKYLLQHDNEYPTSQVLAKMSNSNEVSYEIIFPVAWDFISDSNYIKSQLHENAYFIYGSLASRNQVTRNTLYDLLESSAIKVFDINLRPPFINKEILSHLLQKADIVKFNQSELEIAQTQFRGSYSNEADQIAFIQDRFDVREVLVTKGEFGAAYYYEDKVYRSCGTEIEVTDTIGSGDAFLAAFVANHYLKETPQIMLNRAVLMGGFVATKKGGCPEYQLNEYMNFKN
jgi:fructokinase